MNDHSFIPVPSEGSSQEEVFTVHSIDESVCRRNLAKKIHEQEQEHAGKNVFQRAIDVLCNVIPGQKKSVQEMDEMIEHFHKAILYLQKEKNKQLMAEYEVLKNTPKKNTHSKKKKKAKV